MNPAPFDGNLPSFRRDFEPIATRSFACRSDKHGATAVLVFHKRSHVIFDLDIMKPADVTEGVDPAGHAEKPLKQVQLVGTLVHKHAAAFARPSRPPTSGCVIGIRAEPGGDNPNDSMNRTQLSLPYEVA